LGQTVIAISGNTITLSGPANEAINTLQTRTFSPNTITLSSPATVGAGTGNLTFYQVTGVDKLGPGGLVLTGPNTYTGVTLINSGTVTVKDAKIVGMAVNTLSTATNANLGRTFTFTVESGLTTNGLTIGQVVTGPGITPGTVITAINNATTFTTNQGAIQSSTSALTFGSVVPQNGTISSAINQGSATVTVASTAGLTRGQAVLGTGIPAGATINTIVSATQFTMTANATQSNSTANLTYSGGTIFSGNKSTVITSGARIVVANTLGFTVGQLISGTGIPVGARIARILDDNTIEISLAVTSTGTNTLTFGVSGNIGGTLAGTTISGSNTITVASTAGLSVGEGVTGLGIPEGTSIAAILNNTDVVLSGAALFTGTSPMVFEGSAGGLGQSRNAAANLVFN
jgi:autotransporter-associated beta strand protein